MARAISSEVRCRIKTGLPRHFTVIDWPTAIFEISTSILEDQPKTYIVKEGDNLFDIAYRLNVNFNEIVTLNSIQDPSIININQILLIPRNQVNNVLPKEKILVVSGYGSGHGVGMSQWGAKHMANQGAKAKTILKHFYKGVEIKPFKKYFL